MSTGKLILLNIWLLELTLEEFPNVPYAWARSGSKGFIFLVELKCNQFEEDVTLQFPNAEYIKKAPASSRKIKEASKYCRYEQLVTSKAYRVKFSLYVDKKNEPSIESLMTIYLPHTSDQWDEYPTYTWKCPPILAIQLLHSNTELKADYFNLVVEVQNHQTSFRGRFSVSVGVSLQSIKFHTTARTT